MKKKVCVVTAARSEYGLLRWVIDEIHKSEDIQLQLIVTGSHLSSQFGATYKDIEEDGYHIDEKVSCLLDNLDKEGVSKTMALCQFSITEAFQRLNPDLLVVLGDRYELLPICSSALVLGIPIAHVSGGDITEGAIDNKVRNAITMMADYHFPGTEESASRIRRMIGNNYNVFVTGETNLDNFLMLPRLSRLELSKSLHLKENKKWILCTYHSETMLTLNENIERVKHLIKLFSERYNDYEIVISKSNADYGGTEINKLWQVASNIHSNIHLFDSLGQSKYISMLYQTVFMIGNSSSGIFESPVVGVPVVNIGDRQKGRLLTSNIISAEGTYNSILDSSKIAEEVYQKGVTPIDNPYGDGRASIRLVSFLKKVMVC